MKHNIDLSDTECGAMAESTVEVFTLKDFKKQFIEKSGNNEFQCLICKVSLPSKNAKNKHIRCSHSKIKTMKCSFCEQYFFSEIGRSFHMKEKHPGEYQCEVCSFQAVKHKKLVKHSMHLHGQTTNVVKSNFEVKDLPLKDISFVKYITGTKEFKTRMIADVNKFFEKSNLSKKEKKEVIKLEEYLKEEIFSKKEFMKKFFRKCDHAEFRCLVCGFNYCTAKSDHIRSIHSRIETLKCSFCDQRFYSARARSNHMKNKHPQEYRCNICQFQAVKHATLVRHCKLRHKQSTNVLKSKFEVEDIPLDDVEFIKWQDRHVKMPTKDQTIFKCKKERKIAIKTIIEQINIPSSVIPETVVDSSENCKSQQQSSDVRVKPDLKPTQLLPKKPAENNSKIFNRQFDIVTSCENIRDPPASSNVKDNSITLNMSDQAAVTGKVSVSYYF